MIKVYLATIPSLYEGEDIEVRYSIMENEELLRKETIFLEYVKPVAAGLEAMDALFRILPRYKKESISIFINDPALLEILQGTSTTKNVEIVKTANNVKRQLKKFADLSIISLTHDKAEWEQWNNATII